MEVDQHIGDTSFVTDTTLGFSDLTITDDSRSNTDGMCKPPRVGDITSYPKNAGYKAQQQLEARYQAELKEKEAEIQRLQRYVETEIMDLQQRQREVESLAPIFHSQLQEAKNSLQDLTVSDETYHELKQKPPEGWSLLEAVRVAVFDALDQLRKENSRLRITASTAQEAASRFELEANRLRREQAHVNAALAERDREAEAACHDYQSQCLRLQEDLQQAYHQVEVLTAKGKMYDTLQSKIDDLEARNCQLMALEEANKKLRDIADQAESRLRDRDHSLELLLMDKAYLSKEVEHLQQQVDKKEHMLQEKENKIRDLKKARQDLTTQLLSNDTTSKEKLEAHFQNELQRLQSLARSDLERVQRESSETYEREMRVLRDMRDQAVADHDRCQVALRERQANFDELMTTYQDMRKASDLKITELQGQLKLKEFELQRLQVLCDDYQQKLEQSVMQQELLQEKVRTMTTHLYDLEAECHRSQLERNHELQGRGTRRILWEDGTAAAWTMNRDDTAMIGSTGQVSLLGDQEGRSGPGCNALWSEMCDSLRREKKLVEEQNDVLKTKLHKLQNDLDTARQQLQDCSQPQALLLDALSQAEAKRERAEAALITIQRSNSQQDEENHQLVMERQALKRDLEKLLTERGVLKTMKTVVENVVRKYEAKGKAH